MIQNLAKKSKSGSDRSEEWARPVVWCGVGLPPLSKYLYGILLICLILASGCTSFSGRRTSSADSQSREPVVQFLSEAYVSTIGSSDRQVQFFQRSVRLNSRELILGGLGTGSERILLSTIDSAALFLGDVSHPTQLQLSLKGRRVAIQVLSPASNNDDRRTQQLYEMLATNGVPRGRTDQFYYVGMNLDDARSESDGDGFFAAAAGARFGSFLWDSIKGFGSLLVKPFVPLF